MKMFVKEDNKRCFWAWYTYPDGQKIDSTNVSPAEYIGYDKSARKEMSKERKNLIWAH
ncbi:MAG: hypothetical protein DDT19_00772 [Syntrophomonadaceae bacterium]|nr:hypothetical protein [Bacillota bacterium]